MKLKRREKVLTGLAGGLVALTGVWFLLFGGDPRPDEQLIAERGTLEGDIADKKKQIEAADRDAKRLAEWQRRSLPSETTDARRLYGDWLRDLAKKANFSEFRLDSTEPGAHHDQYTKLNFKLTAQARLSDLIQFMYDFYSAGYLHQIRKLNVKPNKESGLSVDMTIEAMSLPKAVSTTQLPKEAGHVLQLAKLADYRDPLVKRDFFAAYRAQRRAAPRGVDPADFTFVTGFTAVDGDPKVWFKDRMADTSFKLGNGESFNVGNVKCTVQTVRPEGEVVVDFDGHRRQLRGGDNLRGGVEVQAPQTAKVEAGANSGDADPDEDD